MPRDLFSSKEEALVASPESQTPKPDGNDTSVNATNQDGNNEFTIHRDDTRQPNANALRLRNGRAKEKKMNDLHPYVQTLSISNVEDCVALENAVFPEHERCSREKVGSKYLVLNRDFLCPSSNQPHFLFERVYL